MKTSLAVLATAALLIGLLPGCRDFVAEDFQQERAARTAAEAKVAVMEQQLTTLQEQIADLQKQLDQYKEQAAQAAQTASQQEAKNQAQAEADKQKIAELESELEKWRTGLLPEQEPLPPEATKPLVVTSFRYRGLDNLIEMIQITIVSATWDANKLTVKWEILNTGIRKWHPALLSLRSRDQMGLRGERTVNKVVTEDPAIIYPGLQTANDAPWPGEVVPFTTIWDFGPLSSEIIIELLLVDIGKTYPALLFDTEPAPVFTLKR